MRPRPEIPCGPLALPMGAAAGWSLMDWTAVHWAVPLPGPPWIPPILTARGNKAAHGTPIPTPKAFLEGSSLLHSLSNSTNTSENLSYPPPKRLTQTPMHS